ncbi:Rv3235 family protein [Streptomyces sp. SCL15-4]|uniref:Rv3235 family protein n=1 Tax=Streptomyces sp. SCL15-4 TaxID=2967221 RepID=UPI002966D5CB|nr:Rv3235 family protein [Streptomyces sp. SCL15-4]
MNKVMSRAVQPRPRHRPPTRRDTRRPGGAPPRMPSRPAATRADRPRTAPETAPRQPRPTDLFADRLLAVLSGQRPVHWMLRHTAGHAYDDLARLAERSPLRTRGARPVVHDIGYYVAGEGTLEVFARIATGERLRAMAFRLERGRDLRWRCTAVETGPA